MTAEPEDDLGVRAGPFDEVCVEGAHDRLVRGLFGLECDDVFGAKPEAFDEHLGDQLDVVFTAAQGFPLAFGRLGVAIDADEQRQSLGRLLRRALSDRVGGQHDQGNEPEPEPDCC